MSNARKKFIPYENPPLADQYFHHLCESVEHLADNEAILWNAVLFKTVDDNFKSGDYATVIWNMRDGIATFYRTSEDLHRDETDGDVDYDWSTLYDVQEKDFQEHSEEIDAIDVSSIEVCRTYNIQITLTPTDTPETLEKKRRNLKRKLWLEKRAQQIEDAKTPEEKEEDAHNDAEFLKKFKTECAFLLKD